MIWVVYVSIIIALLYAFFTARGLFRLSGGDEKMQSVASAILEGANAFMKRQYKTIAVMTVVFAIIIVGIYAYTGQLALGLKTGVALIFGAVCSAIAGIIAMYVSVRANSRVAFAATKSLAQATVVALRGGAVSGIAISALSLLGIAVLYNGFGLTASPEQVPFLLVGYAFGASFVALFAQLGGGIFTKAADVGADLVGKVEKGIPEDDARNPAVIADLVGDNVGDCAGRGADIFESTAAENIASMIIAVSLFPVFGVAGILFPLVINAFGLLASIVGILSVRGSEKGNPLKSLIGGYFVTLLLSTGAFYVVTMKMLKNIAFFWAGLVGIIVSILIVIVTMYYTESTFRPVKRIAKASQFGHATNVIQGFAMALECTALPIIILSVGIILAYNFGVSSGVDGGGIFGVAVATLGMLMTAAYVLAMDIFGPITDNAGGIVEMSGAGPAVRKRTDVLDAVGNSTKALTKGYAIGSAAMAAILLFTAYLDQVSALSGKTMDVVNIAWVGTFVGGLIGAMLVFLFSSFAIRAVSDAAGDIIDEVRRQFRTMKGIMSGKQKPDYAACVDIATKSALKEMILPGVLVVVATLSVGLWLGAEAVAAFLIVGTISGILMALVLNTGGGAWDNTKKHLEAHGLKGTDVHKAAVTGDTIGDPFKDTAGPSLHVLIKLLGTLTLVLAPFFI